MKVKKRTISKLCVTQSDPAVYEKPIYTPDGVPAKVYKLHDLPWLSGMYAITGTSEPPTGVAKRFFLRAYTREEWKEKYPRVTPQSFSQRDARWSDVGRAMATRDLLDGFWFSVLMKDRVTGLEYVLGAKHEEIVLSPERNHES